MLRHLKWARDKVDKLRDSEDISDLLLEAQNTMRNMDRQQLSDVVLYLMGRINEER